MIPAGRGGTAYAQELPRDWDRFFGIRVAFASHWR
jgi:hypothetical protein